MAGAKVEKRQKRSLVKGNNSKELLVSEVRSFVIKSLEYQKRRRIQSAGWLLIPVFMLGLPSEYFWREEVVRQNYRSIENATANGTEEESAAAINLVAGCWVNKQYAWLPTYFRDRIFGNCRSLQSVDLSGAKLNSANLSGAYLVSANLSGADLSGAKLSGANLMAANLSGADLSGGNLSGAKLNSANLSGAYLMTANLSSADLGSANLSGAEFLNAHLSGADLGSANLSGAYLLGAKLSGANLMAANLKNVRFECRKDFPCIYIGGTDMTNIKWNNITNWEGIKGWEDVENIPPELKKQLNLP
jgi:uncharacterized protein YjbI with pentapeptide repeats